MVNLTELPETNGKALLLRVDNRTYLFSYVTMIMSVEDGYSTVRYYDEELSNTTARHIKLFSGLSKREFFDLPLVGKDY